MDFDDVAAHAASGFLGLINESRKFGNRVHLVSGVGGDETEAAFDGVAVGIDEAGEKALALEVDALGIRRDRFQDLGQISDGNNFSGANGDGIGIGILRVGGENLGVIEDAFVLREGGCQKKNGCGEQKNAAKPRDSSHDRPFLGRCN